MSKVIEVFTVGEGEDAKEYAVVEPTIENQAEAKKEYNRAFKDAIDSNAILREELEAVLRHKKIWSDELQREVEEIQREVGLREKRLAAGGMRLDEARKLAIEVRRYRRRLLEVLAPRHTLDNNTAQAQAENMQFNSLVASCVVYNDSKKRVYSTLEEYLNNAHQEVALRGGSILASRLHNYDNNYEDNLPENKFLKKYGFMDEDGALTDRKGNYVTEDGAVITKDGHYLNEEGQRVDKWGNLLDENGEYVVEYQPFLDEDGNPVE